MRKSSSIRPHMLLMLIVAFPFAIIAGQLNLDPCRWWAVYSIAAAVATLARSQCAWSAGRGWR
ncbi:hypothetical protein [Mycobacterium sp. NPDC050853]|uniref:hypothetical protein n=1 Tax=Mycobacterium sp. NPDC050853 TaxID=3155160 RepID=UPI0033F11591